MTLFETFFGGRLFCINCDHRPDRWAHAEAQFKRQGWTTVQRFPGITGIVIDGRINANAGCTASHRALLDLIVANGWPNAMILEDDFDIIYTDFAERFDRFAAELPPNWDQLFLGGGYAEPPLARLSPHVIRCGRMLTTSSYGITLEHARRVAPALTGVGPVDSAMGGFHRDAMTVVISPRCVVQYPSFSDLQECDSGNAQSMLSRDLEASL